MRVTLIHNPEAGSQKHEQSHLAAKLARRGDEVTSLSSASPDFEQTLLDEGPELLVVAGGDGTVGQVVRTIANRRDVPLLILPFGTANNVADSLGIDKPELDLRIVRERWTRKTIDVAGIGDGLAVESAGCGVIAGFMRVASDDEREGVKREAKSLADRVESSPRFDYRIRVDGEEKHGEALAIEVMVLQQMGPRVVLCRDSDPSDGALDLVIIDEASREMLARYLRSRSKRNPPSFASRRARSVTIACDAPWHVDGEMKDRRTRTIEVRRNAWVAMVPQRRERP